MPRLLVFYVQPVADPPVVDRTLFCGDDAAMISTSLGSVRADQLAVGLWYKYADKTVRRIDAVEIA
jgi:hypothetical protein